MTLIAGTIGWNGVYIATDTRVTKKPINGGQATFSDDILKCEMLTGGITLAVAGSAFVSKLLKECIERKHIEWYQDALVKKANGHTFTETPTEVLENIVRESIQEVFSSSAVIGMGNDDSAVSGLAALVDTVPMELSQQECKKIVEIIDISSAKNSVVQKHESEIRRCAKGEIPRVVLSEFLQGCLVAYESRVPGVLNVEPVRIGEIRVYGSGTATNHTEEQKRTLGYMLCETEPQELRDVAFHLTRTHAISDRDIPVDPRFGFKTFGGGIVPTFLIEDPNNPGHVELTAVELDLKLKPDGRLFSSLFHDSAGHLHIINSDGSEFVLTKFSDYSSPHKLFLEI